MGFNTACLVKIHQKSQGEKNSRFFTFSDTYIHFMLCRNFELIPIKVGFFKKFFKLLKGTGYFAKNQ